MGNEWLLTPEDVIKDVEKWLDEDCTNYLSVSRGYWELLVPIIAKAQAKKLVKQLDEASRHVNPYSKWYVCIPMGMWQALRKEVLKEER